MPNCDYVNLLAGSNPQYTRFDQDNQYSASHWSQRKVKSFRLQRLATGQVTVLCAPRVPPARFRRHSLDYAQLEKAKRPPSRRDGCEQLNQEINHYLPPLHLTRNISTPGPALSRHQSRPFSASNERAKQGFKFWVDDISKSTGGSNRTLGSRGSFLGIGVPRL